MCLDNAPLIPEPVSIQCSALDGQPLITEPAIVAPGGSFTVSSPTGGILPQQIDCLIASSNGPLQRNLIDTSGTVPLSLGDKYGALQLERCGELNCRETFCYDAQVTNIGSVPMLVDLLDFSFSGVSMSLLESIASVNPVDVGQSVSTGGPKIDVDICVNLEYSAGVSASASPPNGPTCQDAEDLTIALFFNPEMAAPVATPVDTPPIVPPPDEGTCNIEIDAQCVIQGDTAAAGLPCSSPVVGIEPCLARPTGATMLLNGGNCATSDNIQGLKFTCDDLGGPGVPTEVGSEVHVLVTDIKGEGIVYFDGMVRVGDFYALNDGGNRFQADQFIQISSPDRSTVLQEVQYHSSCSSNLELKNRFGASQLVGFFNEVQGNVTCFNVFEFSLGINIPITAAGDMIQITSLAAMTNFAGTIDLTPQVQGQLISGGGDVIVATLSGTIDTSVRREYNMLLSITGIQADGSECSGMSTISFDAGNVPGAPRPPGIGLTPTVNSMAMDDDDDDDNDGGMMNGAGGGGMMRRYHY